jgi:hypothetical protein
MLKKLKNNKFVKSYVRFLKITPCVCDHECNCKKENK